MSLLYFTIGSIYPSIHSHRHANISYDFFRRLFCCYTTKKTPENNHRGGGGVSVQRPPQGPSKICIFTSDFNKKIPFSEFHKV